MPLTLSTECVFALSDSARRRVRGMSQIDDTPTLRAYNSAKEVMLLKYLTGLMYNLILCHTSLESNSVMTSYISVLLRDISSMQMVVF